MSEVEEPVVTPPGRRPWWWIAAGAVLAAAVLVGVIWSTRVGQPAAGGPSESPTPVASDSATATPSAEPSSSPSVSPTPTSTRKLTPYCRDYLAILGGRPSEDPDDEESPDTGSISDTFGKWLKRYTAAATHAPADLRPRYAKVIRYLKDAIITFDTGDWNATRAQLKQMPTLNKTMDAIETRSKKLCG